MYDIVYIGNKTETGWKELSQRYPFSKIASDFYKAQQKSLTKFFWVVWNDLKVRDDFDFNHIPDEWSSNYIHVFKNDHYFDGILLVPKYAKVSPKEVEYRFFTNKKEVDIPASTPILFDQFTIDTYDQYVAAATASTTDMFWAVLPGLEVSSNFKFNYQVPVHNQHITHVFKNGDFYDGICLFSKNKLISQREFNYRFFTNKKEIDVLASTPKQYDKIIVNNYAEFLEAKKTTTTDFIYVITNDINVSWDFNYQIPYADRNVIHVFKNGKFYDGVFLIHKDNSISKREFDYKFFMQKTEIDILASTPKPYDIVFISYQEPNAEENYNALLKRFPNTKRVHGVKGIHQAHIAAANLCNTDLFYVVDGDAVILDSFNFNYQVESWNKDCVHVWKSINPINDLEYGYGGAKLLPRELTINMDLTNTDMTTSISSKFKAVKEISNITAFNTDEFSTWRSAFRECCKLASKTIKGQNDEETNERLAKWCSDYSRNRELGDYAISGARAGRKYGISNINNPSNLKLINDFDWLHEQFSANTI